AEGVGAGLGQGGLPELGEVRGGGVRGPVLQEAVEGEVDVHGRRSFRLVGAAPERSAGTVLCAGVRGARRWFTRGKVPDGGRGPEAALLWPDHCRFSFLNPRLYAVDFQFRASRL